jgi:hypothetical protein
MAFPPRHHGVPTRWSRFQTEWRCEYDPATVLEHVLLPSLAQMASLYQMSENLISRPPLMRTRKTKKESARFATRIELIVAWSRVGTHLPVWNAESISLAAHAVSVDCKLIPPSAFARRRNNLRA